MADLFHYVSSERAAELIEAMRSGIEENAERIAEIPKEERVALASGIIESLGLATADLLEEREIDPVAKLH